jgi:hypothetical protein
MLSSNNIDEVVHRLEQLVTPAADLLVLLDAEVKELGSQLGLDHANVLISRVL